MVQAGVPITYVLTVKNEGLVTAQHMIIRDTLPKGANFLAALNGQLVGAPLGVQQVEWNVDNLPPGHSLPVQMIVTATQSLVNVDYAVNIPDLYRVAGDVPVLTLISQDTAVGTANPQTGGVVTSNSGNLSVNFSSGALTMPVTVTLTASAPINEAGFGGIAFSINAVDNAGNPVKQFAQPITLTLHYTDVDWQSAGLIEESALNLYFWDGQAWVPILPCAGCTHDQVNNLMIVRLNHLTLFALRSTETHIALPFIKR